MLKPKKFLKSEKGKKLLNSICLEMKEIGFPEISSKIELDLLIEIFSPENLFVRFSSLKLKFNKFGIASTVFRYME